MSTVVAGRPDFRVLSEIRRGLCTEGASLLRKLRQRYNIPDEVEELLLDKSFDPSPLPETVTLVAVRGEDLGLTAQYTRRQFFRRARRYGLRTCRQEDALLLRLAYPNQPCGEWLIVGMDPIRRSKQGNWDVCFHVEHVVKGDPTVRPATSWVVDSSRPDYTWVMVRSKFPGFWGRLFYRALEFLRL